VKEVVPCPFCGNKEIDAQQGTKDRKGTPCNMVCSECGASGPRVYLSDSELDSPIGFFMLITSWNVRKGAIKQVAIGEKT